MPSFEISLFHSSYLFVVGSSDTYRESSVDAYPRHAE